MSVSELNILVDTHKHTLKSRVSQNECEKIVALTSFSAFLPSFIIFNLFLLPTIYIFCFFLTFIYSNYSPYFQMLLLWNIYCESLLINVLSVCLVSRSVVRITESVASVKSRRVTVILAYPLCYQI
ncbi:hypothetical protein QL285_018848 [Trifolium repens]|nr:hypothetical protein QL285_018848 [Trifolium repens]